MVFLSKDSLRTIAEELNIKRVEIIYGEGEDARAYVYTKDDDQMYVGIIPDKLNN